MCGRCRAGSKTSNAQTRPRASGWARRCGRCDAGHRGSWDGNELRAPAGASITPFAPLSPVETTSSLVGIERLGCRSTSSTHISNQEYKAYTLLSTLPGPDGHSADTKRSPERRLSATPNRYQSEASLYRQSPLDVAVDASLAGNPATGTGHGRYSRTGAGIGRDDRVFNRGFDGG